ncbi:MAG: ATP-binding cassette domain-containing protein, partial [Gammaproteobacteria bacterium]|nr:ATP-binding cassette domain-containing protein [Gammaproteobacteria bacterium]
MVVVDNLDLYYGASQALYGISIQAQIGKITCVLGRNGVGKTTLMRAISGRHIAQSGSIQWCGEEIR